MKRLSIAKDFTETPGPRFREEGDFSGQQFLEDHLRPHFEAAIKSGDELLIDFDGAEGYATSFLEAAFGGLARDYDSDKVLKVLRFKCEDEPSLIKEVESYIRDANKKKTA
jgi:hypothetical protein